MKTICQIRKFKKRPQAEAAIELLRSCGVKAVISPKDLGHGHTYDAGKSTPLFVEIKHSRKASMILSHAMMFAAKSSKSIQLPPEEGKLELDDPTRTTLKRLPSVSNASRTSVYESQAVVLLIGSGKYRAVLTNSKNRDNLKGRA